MFLKNVIYDRKKNIVLYKIAFQNLLFFITFSKL